MTEHDFNPFQPALLAQRAGSGEISAPYSLGAAPITTDYALASPRSARSARRAAQRFAYGYASSGSDEEAGGGAAGAGPGPGGGAAGPAAARPAAAGAGPSAHGAGPSAHCAAGVPPGLNPLAVMEVRASTALSSVHLLLFAGLQCRKMRLLWRGL